VPCSTLIDPGCVAHHVVSGIQQSVSGIAGFVTGDFLDALASGIRTSVTWIFTNLTTWWLKLPSPDLAHESAIGAMQQWLLPVTAAVAIAGIIAAGARMALTRRANPLLDVGGGLVTIAAAGTLGVLVPNLLLQAGDAWSGWVLQVSSHGSFGSRMTSLFALTGVPAAVVIVYGFFALVMATIQAALLMFRQAAVVILAAVLPLAAAGSMAPMTRNWIRKIVSWMLALIMYKPAAAAVYATAFTMIGKGSNLQTIMMGFAMLALSLLAMPVLMKFFTWTTGAITSGGGAGQFLGMAAGGMVAAGAVRGSAAGAGGASASEHAGYLGSAQTPPSAAADGASGAGAPGTPAASATGSAQPTAGDANAAADTRTASTGGPAASGAADGPGGTASGGAAGGSATGAAAAGTAIAATAGLAGVATAAVLAGQGLASGAREAAATATDEGDSR
jgi:hypothetical protein